MFVVQQCHNRSMKRLHNTKQCHEEPLNDDITTLSTSSSEEDDDDDGDFNVDDLSTPSDEEISSLSESDDPVTS